MVIKKILILVLPLVFLFSCANDSAKTQPAVFSGDAYTIGLTMGEQYSGEINDLIENWLYPKIDAVPVLLDLFSRVKTGGMDFTDDSLEEIAGLSESTQVDQLYLIEATASPDLMTLAGTPFGCSSLVVSGGLSATGGMVVGHNLDFPDSALLRKYFIPVVLAKTGTFRILSIQLPGLVGILNAINEKGVTVAVHMVNTTDTNSSQTPVLVAARMALEKGSTAREALQIYQKTPVTVPMNILFADGREAFVLESTATESAVRALSNTGGLIVANHFESNTLAQTGPESDARWPILTAAVNSRKRFSLDDVKQTIGAAGGFEAAGGESNVLAFFVDYSTRTLYWGSDTENEDRSALGKLYEIKLQDVFGN